MIEDKVGVQIGNHDAAFVSSLEAQILNDFSGRAVLCIHGGVAFKDGAAAG